MTLKQLNINARDEIWNKIEWGYIQYRIIKNNSIKRVCALVADVTCGTLIGQYTTGVQPTHPQTLPGPGETAAPPTPDSTWAR